MKPLPWILVPAILLLGLVGGVCMRMAAASWAADEWLARGHPHPIHGITTYGPLLPSHRDKIIARWGRVLPKGEARAKMHDRHQRAVDCLKAGLASLNAGKAFYTDGGATRTAWNSGPREFAVSFNARVMFDGSENPVPPVRGFGALWAKLVNTTVTVNIAIPY